MMPAAYRGCARLSTHILCLLNEGDVIASGAGTIGGRARARAVTRAVHAHDVAAFTHAARRGWRSGRSLAAREHDAGGPRDQWHEQRADGRARRGRPFEKPRGDGADRGRAEYSPPADLNVHELQSRQARCQTRGRRQPSQDLHAAEVRERGSIGAVFCKSLLRLYVRPAKDRLLHRDPRRISRLLRSHSAAQWQ